MKIIDPLGQYVRGERVTVKLNIRGEQPGTVSHFHERSRQIVIVKMQDNSTLGVHRTLISSLGEIRQGWNGQA
jgi:hypothetical protein